MKSQITDYMKRSCFNWIACLVLWINVAATLASQVLVAVFVVTSLISRDLWLFFRAHGVIKDSWKSCSSAVSDLEHVKNVIPSHLIRSLDVYQWHKSDKKMLIWKYNGKK